MVDIGPMIHIGDEIQVKIEKMANRGKGLARLNEQVIFIPYSAPGDILKVKVVKISKSFVDAEIIEIIQPSAIRVAPPCPYFTQCGGCQFQHIEYTQQIEIKNFLVKETLQRAVGLKDDSIFLPPIASPKQWNYRNRIQVHFDNNKFGFKKRNSNTIIPIDACQIAELALNQELETIKTSKSVTSIDKLEILVDQSLMVHRRDLNSQGQPVLFSQVNRFANEVLVELIVSKVLAFKPVSKIFDLYAGDGNFLIPLAKALPEQECIAVELNPGLVRLGRAKVSDQKLNATFVLSSVEKFTESVSIDRSEVILLDPPRTGCDSRTMMVLGSSARDKVIYVSCEATTLARDLRLLKETVLKWGLMLNVHSVQTLDMFPQTEHIETVVEFSIDKIDTRKTTH